MDFASVFWFLLSVVITLAIVGVILKNYDGGDNDDYFPW